MQVYVSKHTQVYPLPMKYERAGMGNTLRNCGSIAERIVKACTDIFCSFEIVGGHENINHAIACIFEMREQVAEMAGKNYGNLKAYRK